MMAVAYYNEFDPKVATWLRQLIKNGEIADGEVDERSITDVEASDLRGFSQHHFFAGIGTWSYALRNAGWSDDRPVCTASLPCQPFSAAGNQKGKQDERHLLPHFIELVRQCNFDTIIGEQVPGAIKHGWLDDLYDEMERENYAVGSVVLTAAGAGKAHIRQRLYWVADTQNRNRRAEQQQPTSVSGQARIESGGGRTKGGLADTINAGSEGRISRGTDQKRQDFDGHTGCDCSDCRMGNTEHDGCDPSQKQGSNDTPIQQSEEGPNSPSESQRDGSSRAIPEESIEWIYCADNKYRPIKSGIKPLVDGLARGVVYSGGAIYPNNTALAKNMRIKGYGNAIVEPLARQFISAYMEIIA